jgi:hypothetical protein
MTVTEPVPGGHAQARMQVRKRNGDAEPVDVNKIVRAVPSSPTLFNSGTSHPQMSSCFLVDSPRDDLGSIYERYAQVARLSKFSGGIGIGWSRVRSRGALIRGTNGASNGIVPFLKTLDASVAAVNQGGRRKGAACAYLEPWHPDVEEFLELRDNTGEDARRTHNLNLANWIQDEFMRRVEADETWSLIDPDAVPGLADLWGDAFDAAYRKAEEEGRYVRQVQARDLYGKMMRTLAGAVHRPVPVAQLVHGRADDRPAVVDVHARLEERPEDDLLPAFPARQPDPAGDGRRRCPRAGCPRGTGRDRGDRLLP